MVSRSEIAASSQKIAQGVNAKLVNRIDQWAQRSQSEGLSYSKKKSKTQNLLQLLVSPEERVLTPEAAMFRVPNSMREVQPEINLISPPSLLAPKTHGGAPKWGFRSKTEGDGDE